MFTKCVEQHMVLYLYLPSRYAVIFPCIYPLQMRQMASRSQMRKLRTEPKILNILCQGRGILQSRSVQPGKLSRTPRKGRMLECAEPFCLHPCVLAPRTHHAPALWPSRCRDFELAGLGAWATAPSLLRVRSQLPYLDPREALPSPLI